VTSGKENRVAHDTHDDRVSLGRRRLPTRADRDYGGHGGTDQLNRMYRRYEGICQLCDHWIPRDQASREHVVPLQLGGSRGDENCVLACVTCNQAKNEREHDPYPQWIFKGIGGALIRQRNGLPATQVPKQEARGAGIVEYCSTHWHICDERRREEHNREKHVSS
jgi:hypothetical protein